MKSARKKKISRGCGIAVCLLAGFLLVPQASFANSSFILENQPDEFDPDTHISLSDPEPISETEQEAPMAEAIVTGAHVRRLLLDGPVSMVVDDPQTAFRLPPGTYRGRLILAGEQEEDATYEARLRRITIEDNQLNTFTFGGPLNHAVNIRRSGSRLILDYRLHGIGDEEYSRTVGGRRERPGVTILCRGEEVASGSFEYG